MPCFLQLKFFFVTSRFQVPGFDRRHHLVGYAKGRVDFAVQWLGCCGLPDFQHAAIRNGKNNGHDLMSTELLANGPTMRCEYRLVRTDARQRPTSGKPARKGRCASVSDSSDDEKWVVP